MARETAERIRSAVARTVVECRDVNVTVTVSIGCAELSAADADECGLSNALISNFTPLKKLAATE
ncbi:MAG: hypothetical protein WDO69_32550 [Pseudomonadota bacterium]